MAKALLGKVMMRVGRAAFIDAGALHGPEWIGSAKVTICNAELTQRQSMVEQCNGNVLRGIGGAERGLAVRWQ